MCPIQGDLLSVTFDPETAEIRWRIVTDTMKTQHFTSLPGFPHKGHATQDNQILPHARGLKGHTIRHENFEKICPKKFAPSLICNIRPTRFLSGTKRRIDEPKCYCQSTLCPLQGDLLSVTFDPETAEIRWRIVIHSMIIQHLLSLSGFQHKNH